MGVGPGRGQAAEKAVRALFAAEAVMNVPAAKSGQCCSFVRQLKSNTFATASFTVNNRQTVKIAALNSFIVAPNSYTRPPATGSGATSLRSPPTR